jgi:dienelactone hydrolase
MTVAEAAKIKTKILVLHGAIDPFVPEKDIVGFVETLNEAKTDYQFIAYSNAVHAFAVPGAGNNPKSGAAYNETADRRSWGAFRQFLDEVAPQ